MPKELILVVLMLREQLYGKVIAKESLAKSVAFTSVGKVVQVPSMASDA